MSKNGAKLWTGSLQAGKQAGFSLITGEITRLDLSLKQHFAAQSSSWGALQTGGLLPLQEERQRSCADRQL